MQDSRRKLLVKIKILYSNNAAIKSKESESGKVLVAPEDLSIQQLQELLAKRQLKEEQSNLEASANIVRANTEEKNSLKAIVPTIYLFIIIGGIPVEAMVDTVLSLLSSLVHYSIK